MNSAHDPGLRGKVALNSHGRWRFREAAPRVAWNKATQLCDVVANHRDWPDTDVRLLIRWWDATGGAVVEDVTFRDDHHRRLPLGLAQAVKRLLADPDLLTALANDAGQSLFFSGKGRPPSISDAELAQVQADRLSGLSRAQVADRWQVSLATIDQWRRRADQREVIEVHDPVADEPLKGGDQGRRAPAALTSYGQGLLDDPLQSRDAPGYLADMRSAATWAARQDLVEWESVEEFAEWLAVEWAVRGGSRLPDRPSRDYPAS